MQIVEQLIAAQQANVEAALTLATKAFDGVEKTVELNLQAAKALLREAAEHAQAVLSAKDAQELLSLQGGLLQPAAEKTAAYSRHIYDITAATNAEVGKVVEAQLAELQKNFLAVVDNALKNAPAGSEDAIPLVKTTATAASNAYVREAAMQATEATGTSVNAVTTSAAEAGHSSPSEAG
jgi:phasin family protein